MNSVAVYRRGDDITHSFVGSENGGGGVDDILRRLGNVESEVHGISTVMPHLATKADLKAEIGQVRVEIANVRGEIAGVRVEVAEVRVEIAEVRGEIAEVKTAVAEVRTEVASMETKIIKWTIATVLTTAGLAFSLAKFVH